jgi:two-component system, sensor histidine kinase YesM
MKRILFFKNWKLNWKFLFIFLVLILLPMLAFSLFIYSKANNAVQLQAIENAKSHLEKAEKNLTVTLQDIEDISSYMIYSEDFRSFLNTNNISENKINLKNLEDRINGYSVFHLNSKPYLHSITLEGMKNNQIHIGPPLIKDDEVRWKDRAIELRGMFLWSGAYTITDYWNRKHKVISLIRVINDINNVTKPIGMVTVRLDTSKLYDVIETDSRGSKRLFVLDENNSVVLHYNNSFVGKKYPDKSFISAVEKMGKKIDTIHYSNNNEEYTVVTQPLNNTNLTLVTLVDNESVAEGIKGIQGSIKLMMIVLTILGIMAMIGFYHFNIKRILLLTKQTKRVEKGDFSATVPEGSTDEIGLLGIRFNKMVERIKYLIDSKYKMEIRTRESELKLLQSQINPHFLYNTLDMIRWTARLEQAMETSKLIEQLSKMFRISLNRGSHWISLKDELTYNQIYLDLQKRRLGKNLTFTLFCDHEVLNATVLKQSIQPLIENSIHHGFENFRTPRNIYVRCYREDTYLKIDVIDNGKGFPSENFEQYLRDGYALSNIQDRLYLAFGDESKISIIPKDSQGAWVRITIPFVEHGVDMKESG